MAAARYWRLVGFQTYAGGKLSISGLQLLSGEEKLTGVLTSSHTPSVGSLAQLDDNLWDSAVEFSADVVSSAGFAIAWEFASPVSVDGLYVGGGRQEGEYLEHVLVMHSQDGVQWDRSAQAGRLLFPGAYSRGGKVGLGITAALLCHFDGADKSTPKIDYSSVERVWNVDAPAKISTQHSAFGPSSLYVTGGGCLWMPNQTDMQLLGDFTISLRFRASTRHTGVLVCQRNFLAGNIRTGWGLFTDPNGSMYLQASHGSVTYIETPVNLYQPGAWLQLVVTRKNGTLRMRVNGTVVSSASAAQVNWFADASSPFSVGRQKSTGQYPFDGWIDSLLINTNADLFTDAAAPPAEPFLAEGALLVRTGKSSSFVAADAPPAAFTTRRDKVASALDTEFGGAGRIYGTTKTKNAPTKARVRLLRDRDGLLARETWSDPVTGEFDFPGIDTSQKFTALAADANGDFRPVAANQLTPEVP